MANRLTKIYTRTGDKGTTRLATGAEVHKTHPRVEAMGTVDELNSLIGVVDSYLSEADDLSPIFRRIQNDLFDLGGEIAIADDSYVVISPEMVNWLEEVLDHYNDTLPSLENFILPGGTPDAAHTHLARAVCRRAERGLVELAQESSVNPQAIAYINRLSDLLFVLGRVLARRDGQEEILWQQRSPKS